MNSGDLSVIPPVLAVWEYRISSPEEPGTLWRQEGIRPLSGNSDGRPYSRNLPSARPESWLSDVTDPPPALCYNFLKADGTAFSGREPELFSSLLNRLFASLPGFGPPEIEIM